MIVTAPTYHTPVLLQQSIEGLNIKPDGTYVDVTMGGGGHTREILRQLGPKGKLFCFDQDKDAVKNVPDDKRCIFCRSNFRYLSNWLHYHDAQQVDGVLADLGVSSHHLDDAERGFSFRQDGPLDMRMNQQSAQSAATVVNTYTEEQLTDVFHLYGELKNSRQLARTLVKARETQALQTIGELLKVITPCMPREREKKELAKVFQALRIEVNDEMGALRDMLMATIKVLKPGGRLSVITYHSLEDRLVKNVMKTGNMEGKQQKDFYGNVLSPFTLVNNKVIVPTDEEIVENPRARSAKLRVASLRLIEK